MLEDTKVKFYGTTWCPACRRAQKKMTDKGIDFEWINIDKDMDGREYVMKINNGYRSVPTIVFPDGEILVEPSTNKLIAKLNSLK